MLDHERIRAWVLDLDDTLYLERNYVLSGFAAVGEWLAEARGIPGFGAAAVARFERGARGNIFDLAFADLGVQCGESIVAELVSRYRTHRPQISLTDDAERFLGRLTRSRKVAIISDGPLDSQIRKVQALALDTVAFPIVLTDRWGPGFSKPHERAFLEVQETLGCAASECVYVGDNPAKDFTAPRALGWQTLRVRRPEALHSGVATRRGAVTYEVASFDELPAGI